MTTAHTVLIVEDEVDLCELIGFNLEREGYACVRAGDGEAALAQIERAPPDLIVLDRMLPKTSGDAVIAQLRRQPRTARIPVIMLTARADEADELVGFALGADDYVTKPFSMKALIARVGALLRRTEAPDPSAAAGVIHAGPLTLDTERHEVTLDGVAIAVTATEYRLLKALVLSEGRLRSRDQLIDTAIGPDVAVVDRTIDVHIASLRKKLGRSARWIRTIRGAGYAWRSPPDSDDPHE